MNTLGAFIKFGEYEHLLQLQQYGRVYCNSLDFFSNLERENRAADLYENVTHIQSLGEGTIELWEAETPKPENPMFMNAENVQMRQHRHRMGNIFCVYSLDLTLLHRTEPYIIDGRNSRDGNYFLIIHKPEQFAVKLRNAVRDLGWGFKFNFVEYFDCKAYTGNKTVFQKDLKFKHENEWRAFMKTGSTSPVLVEIGNIEDISQLFCADLNKLKLYSGKSEELILDF